MLQYTTTCPMFVLYIHNLATDLGFAVGNDFVASHQYAQLIDRATQQLPKELNAAISGYIGCNECEVFLHNGDIRHCVTSHPTTITEKISYID